MGLRIKCLRFSPFIFLFCIMFGMWLTVFTMQYNGSFVEKRYPDCETNMPNLLGNGNCDTIHYSPQCGWDHGDCRVDDYPGCIVPNPEFIGDNECDDYLPYNTPLCGYDGGDCVLKQHPDYPDCYVTNIAWIGQKSNANEVGGECEDFPPYNTKECGWDGGDCLRNISVSEARKEDYPNLTDCYVPDPIKIGNGECNSDPPYNTLACNFDGLDCGEEGDSHLYGYQIPGIGYENCVVPDWDEIGNGLCQQNPNNVYNTEECKYDGGDCDFLTKFKFPSDESSYDYDYDYDYD